MSQAFNIKPYIELTKPRILISVLVTTTIGYYLGGAGIKSYRELMVLLLGAGCVCAGAAVLNHYVERDFDKKMDRTRKRPIPAGIIPPMHALSMGLLLTFLGLIILYVQINILTAFLSLLTSFMYVMIYTPMKRVSWLNTTFGAFPGAIPPLGGWAAATGTLNFDAGILFLILFIWQHPHFYAIAWMFKDDYKKAGFKMLPCVEPDGTRMFNFILFSSAILIPVSLVPTFRGLLGNVYFFGAVLSGIGLLFYSVKFNKTHSMIDARNLLKATVIYLPVILMLIVVDFLFK